MGNGTKIALVALLILMVVVIARFVGDSGEDLDTVMDDRIVKPDPPREGAVASSRVRTEANGGRVGAGHQSLTRTPKSPPGGTVPRGSLSNQGRPASVPPRPSTLAAGSPEVRPPVSPPVAIKTVAVQDDTPAEVSRPGVAVPQPSPGVAVATPAGGAPAPIQTTLGDAPSVGTVGRQPSGRSPSSGGSADSSGKTEPVKSLASASGGAESSYPKTHTLQKGDSYWLLAKRYYGHGTIWRQIEKANPGVKVQPGKTLTIPAPVLPSSAPQAVAASSAKRAPAPSQAPAPTGFSWYKVKRKDTLMQLAKQFYNDSSKYELIEDANRAVKYGGLKAGATIKIPSQK